MDQTLGPASPPCKTAVHQRSGVPVSQYERSGIGEADPVHVFSCHAAADKELGNSAYVHCEDTEKMRLSQCQAPKPIFLELM